MPQELTNFIKNTDNTATIVLGVVFLLIIAYWHFKERKHDELV